LLQPHTDTGNAERLVALYGCDIRFSVEMKKWLVWDGRRWNSEDSRRIKLLAKRTMRKMYTQAAAIDGNDAREKAEKHARKSESAAGIGAMLTCAEYEEGIPAVADELDRNPYLLNFLNGTLDLKDGTLYKHRSEDVITKLVHFDFDPQAKCPLFLQFINRIMGASPEASEADLERADRLVSYLQKCFGYSLTGDVAEKAVFCLFGAGNNGKTTLLEIIRFILTEYSTQVLIDSLMMHHSRESNASLADLGDLRGARFVTTSESEEGQRLAVGKLKYLTQGMGEIKTCRKYENPIKFIATHKLFLDANHKPVIRGAEKAVWNRLKPIPFTVTISAEEMDKKLLEKLKAEAPGILAWMFEGYQTWRSEGLGDPPEVAEASAAWQAESDRFPAFLEEKCVLALEAWVPVSQLWSAYQNWCEVNNERFIMPKTSFDERLESLGCKKRMRNDGTVRAWVGIRFRTTDDDRNESDKVTGSDAEC
jgi:putative DNA primase/helicase